ncbi:hypothetical protein ACF08M_30860 [Streptomyces sp. NPDC015032]|uniref:hypothetical protein n=1 Tax=Streptomyces sp. NPDC015032 TaxID=3364937 RepID=UPI003701A94A
MDPDKETARGLAQLEGYLLWSAAVEEARRQADRFTDELPWLTTAQREDVRRVYTADRVAASRTMFRRVRARAAELRGEYDARYRRLRARCVAVVVVLVGAVVGACTAVSLLVR